MKPMQRMQQSLSTIRAGKAERLEGEFPDEMQPVADEMNLLILAGTEIIDRARTQVGNLAHALKTPLSVLTNEAQGNKTDFGAKVSEQVQIMRDHVSLYLDRARRAARAQTLGAATDVEPVLAALGRTIMRINQDRGVKIDVAVSPGLKFRGEVQDLEEMAGNLIDNAAKWSKQAVKISAAPIIDPIDGTQNWLMITVDDDGPGLPADKRAEAVKRGKRLDETKPGSGLGLSIVTETAGMYSGNVILGDAEMGGLRVQLRLPAVALTLNFSCGVALDRAADRPDDLLLREPDHRRKLHDITAESKPEELGGDQSRPLRRTLLSADLRDRRQNLRCENLPQFVSRELFEAAERQRTVNPPFAFSPSQRLRK